MILFLNRKAVFGLILVGIVSAIFMFDTLFELMLELIDISFEAVEEALDTLVEHLFHTELHITQIIVFYSMLLMAAYPMYLLYKRLCTLPRRYRESKANLADRWFQQKQELAASWQNLPVSGKIKWLTGLMVTIVCLMLWIFI